MVVFIVLRGRVRGQAEEQNEEYNSSESHAAFPVSSSTVQCTFQGPFCRLQPIGRFVGYSRQSDRVQYCRTIREKGSPSPREEWAFSGRDGPSVRNRSRPHFRPGTRQEARLPPYAGGAFERIRDHYL